ncbi:MAG: hypothetical protein KDD94_11025, partial [Calditrichaeota bacterium]|nr:hypothetical protein [Calditrichota bacterium]
MKRIIVVILSLLLIACGDDEDNQASKLQQNIAILCNQESGFLTIFDLNSEVKIDSVDLHIELQHYKDAGHTVDDFYINSPRPHFVMTSHDGRYVYVVMTSNNGAVVKLDANFHVINFLQITETNFPAHAQITSDDQTIFISAWTTNGGGSSPDDKNMILRLNSDF